MEFYKRRRQQFLSEAAYNATKLFFEEVAGPGYLEELASPAADANDRRRVSSVYADSSFTNFMLRFTAGEPLDVLRVDFTALVESYERATRYVQEFSQSTTFPPLRFIEIDEYERVLQLIGLCFLLHRRDMLPRIANMFDPSSASSDTLYEDLLAFGLDDRFELDSWYHDMPYRDLINTMYRDTDEESVRDLQNYLKSWYPALASAPWHNSHLAMDDDGCGGYFGYWAIEAAAVAYLMELDDSSFRGHLVYPKDLVDFARVMDGVAESSSMAKADLSRLRVDGGQPCPQTGYWTTPAQQHSRRLFTMGEIMPTFERSAYGATIWQLSEEQ
jgi:hypothetical protein